MGSLTKAVTSGAEQTRQIARNLAQTLQPGDVLALDGDLGAGKTCFIQGLAEGIGFPGHVTSPTFTLLHEYFGGRLPLYHADLYRIDSASEFLRAGLMDYFDSDGVLAIEWAERIAELLPPRAIRVRIMPGDAPNMRIIEIEEPSP